MKRRALLIGNSRGLAGVKRDIANFQAFLMGRYGGAWRRDEIETMMNPTLADLKSKLSVIKAERNDFVIVMFSGHGGYERTTVLEINGQPEVIDDTELMGLAPRQISIFDCCRVVCSYQEERELLLERKLFSVTDSADTIRQRYDSRIMQAIPQQDRLYACKIGQCAWDHDDGTGAYYLNNLIQKAKTISGAFGLVSGVHEEAAQATFTEVWRDKLEYQEPVSSVPKCLSSQELIISLRP